MLSAVCPHTAVELTCSRTLLLFAKSLLAPYKRLFVFASRNHYSVFNVLRSMLSAALYCHISHRHVINGYSPLGFLLCREFCKFFSQVLLVNFACSTLCFAEKRSWRWSTFPPSSPGSIIDAEKLNCRVRNGNGCFLLARSPQIV